MLCRKREKKRSFVVKNYHQHQRKARLDKLLLYVYPQNTNVFIEYSLRSFCLGIIYDRFKDRGGGVGYVILH